MVDSFRFDAPSSLTSDLFSNAPAAAGEYFADSLERPCARSLLLAQPKSSARARAERRYGRANGRSLPTARRPSGEQQPQTRRLSDLAFSRCPVDARSPTRCRMRFSRPGRIQFAFSCALHVSSEDFAAALTQLVSRVRPISRFDGGLALIAKSAMLSSKGGMKDDTPRRHLSGSGAPPEREPARPSRPRSRRTDRPVLPAGARSSVVSASALLAGFVATEPLANSHMAPVHPCESGSRKWAFRHVFENKKLHFPEPPELQPNADRPRPMLDLADHHGCLRSSGAARAPARNRGRVRTEPTSSRPPAQRSRRVL